MPLVYRHRRNDNMKIFYVGATKGDFNTRPFDSTNHNKAWNEVVKSTSYSVELVKEFSTFKEAVELENFMIDSYRIWNDDLINGNRNHTKGSKNLMALKRKGFVRSKEDKLKQGITRGKIVYQYDLQGNFIAEHYSMKQASRMVDGCDKNVKMVCDGIYKQHKGYKFYYEKKEKN